MLTYEDKELLNQKGISEEKIAEQLACFEKGFPVPEAFSSCFRRKQRDYEAG